ncbi:thioredoxin reductase [Bacillus mesophilus]|uniref:FAD-dependent oxidoreductase n=1 Tax=Bacillus mesophilus TaxID=1808955 RepID=A0A6M0QAY0_9BACI|nr:FAD-dependent oxidoreductase [Bacillus mesophilus]MBM7662872.1 thioredoxin reductase [Bacillus mesophilus]NEY73462.1 FAD-dependent oxidoreductase [Bacillus mesophilus]
MSYDLLIIGAGLSGLSALQQAYKRGFEKVLIIDYEKQAGGFTRPFFEMKRFEKEQLFYQQVQELPYEVRYQTTVVGFFPDEQGKQHQVFIQSPTGHEQIEVKRILIATGSLEKPREAQKVPGSRPSGVMTPLLAASLLEKGYSLGERIMLYGTGRITESMGHLLERHGATYLTLDSSEYDLTRITGVSKLSSIQYQNHSMLLPKEEPADVLIYSKGRIPCTFFLKGTGIERDPHHHIIVDEKGRTNVKGVYAAGSCTTAGDDQHEHSIEQGQYVMKSVL